MTYPAWTTFHAALAATRRHTMALISAIGERDYLRAWCERRELERILLDAERCADRVPVAADRAVAQQRLRGTQILARLMIALAPSPSPLAIQQAKRADREADREAEPTAVDNPHDQELAS